MDASRQRQLVLIGSFSLTALLLGGLVGGVVASRTARQQMSDPEFLEQQLKLVSPKSDEPKADRSLAPVRVSVAARKLIQPQRAIVGRLVEIRKVTVAAEVTGKIKKVLVEEGTPVVKDKTVVARIDDVWSRLAERRCRAQIASTDAKLQYELAELDRQERLSEKNVTSKSELQSQQAAVGELQALLKEANVRLEEESERTLRCEIRAPFDGTVVLKHAEEGQHVSPGSPIIDIVSRGEIDARIMVPESVINFVSLDKVLPIRVDPLGEEAPGKVVSVTPYGLSASRTFPVRVRLDDQQGRLKVGMSVTAIIATGPQREALVVAKDAVLVRPDGSTVWVAAAGREGDATEVQPVPVTISVRTPSEYAVEPETMEGRKRLVSGARVVIEGAERLMAGQQVRIVTLDGKPADLAEPEAKVAPGRPTASGRSPGGPVGRREG